MMRVHRGELREVEELRRDGSIELILLEGPDRVTIEKFSSYRYR